MVYPPSGAGRKEARHATRYDVQCQVDGTDETWEAVTINISNSGCCLKLAVPLRIHQTIHIRTMHALIACSNASVRWVGMDPDGFYLAGLSCHES